MNPPASVTSAVIRLNRTCQAGFVIWHTSTSPVWTASKSASDRTTRATPSTTPGDPATPVTSSVASPWPRWNLSGKPQLTRYGNASWVSVTVPTQSRGWNVYARSRAARAAATRSRPG